MPAFEVNDTMATAMEECAEDFVDEKHRRYYDVLQLFSFVLNLFLWVVRPSKWGKQINDWLNMAGGQEVCSTGAALILRHAEFKAMPVPSMNLDDFNEWDFRRRGNVWKFPFTGRHTTQFFQGYDTAMVPPCLFPLSPRWDATAILNAGDDMLSCAEIESMINMTRENDGWLERSSGTEGADNGTACD
jgi:hypothetical protein